MLVATGTCTGTEVNSVAIEISVVPGQNMAMENMTVGCIVAGITTTEIGLLLSNVVIVIGMTKQNGPNQGTFFWLGFITRS